MQDTEMVPYVQNNFEHSPPSTRSNSPSETIEPTTTMTQQHDDEMSDDEISVGCPSPALHTNTSPKSYEGSRIPTYDMESSQDDKDHPAYNNNETSDDYFKPLKRLKMIHLRSEPKRISPTIDTEEQETERTRSEHGVKSFSIMDILNHRPAKPQHSTRIVRPWDLETESEAQHSLERFHRHLKAQQLALLRNDFGAFNASYTSETGSDRSSSVTSDCCSPDIVPTSSSSSSRSRQHHQAGQQQQKGPGSTPLDALFQMTSKTFDSNNGEGSADGQNSHLNLFNNRQQPKKKRKSRTAFTNHQIFELEKRFLYQKYLSPADRDEIAASLGLSNAQVITWFQNRRAKLKRDMEELKKDVESAKMLSAHKSFLENVQDLGILKKKAMVNMQEECPKNLVIAHENMQKLTRF